MAAVSPPLTAAMAARMAGRAELADVPGADPGHGPGWVREADGVANGRLAADGGGA